jgi:hypothetical protein
MLPGQIIFGPTIAFNFGVSNTITILESGKLQKFEGVKGVAVTVYVPGLFQTPLIVLPFAKLKGVKPGVGRIVHVPGPFAEKLNGLPTQKLVRPVIL